MTSTSLPASHRPDTGRPEASAVPRWGKVIDHSRCIGCHACSTACKSENEVPLSVNRTYVKSVDIGEFPSARRAFQVTRCNQCAAPPCAFACPTSAMHQRPDGIVDFDKEICIGCKACIAACPYDAIFINPEDNSAEKCNFCAHRIDMGLEPACVVVCPAEAILVGDLNDSGTKVSSIVGRSVVSVRRPEKETQPKLFYRDAHQATLDPLAAVRPAADLYMWSEQVSGTGYVPSGHPDGSNSAAAAMLSYDVPHRAPWGFKVSLYTLTKGIAAGAYLLPAIFAVSGNLDPDNLLFRWIAPVVSGLFLALTGALLIWDLKKPKLFYLIFTRPQWKSWLVRGSFIIAGFSLVLVLHFVGTLLGLDGFVRGLAVIGIPLALLTAVYTAWLLAQAKARDLWQSALLPVQLAAQCLLAGAAALIPLIEVFIADDYSHMTYPCLAGFAILNLLMIAGEVSLVHATAHARLAVDEMVKGRFARFFWTGIALMVLACLAPWIGTPAALFALAGLLLFEHAYLQSAQSVPLA